MNHNLICTDGKWLQKTYTYNQGQIATISYSTQNGTITTEISNYQNGYLKSITLTGGQVIYDLQQENALGMATSVLSGPVTRNYSYDQYGLPTGRSAQTQAAGTYMNFTYNFNAATGNLNYRKDVTSNLTENFTYDALNRLTGFGGQTVSYDNKGNITQKSGIGNFHYINNNKPYALTGIVQNGNMIPERHQQIIYASFSRPLTITEDGYNAQFTYEAGGDRVRMHVTKNGALVLKRHYLANQYELDEKPGSTREKLYLGGDYYSSGAVLVKENGGAWQVFYINSDYLGSITHIVNSVGAVVEEYSYDAWGRLRNPATHVVYGVNEQPELFLGRGYTGHEHLNWFGLINMNARLYDPVHGRFLAPGPYVQAPDFTQSFNRYGYAWGNPLSYVDPDGEIVWLPIIIGAVIGAYSGGVMANNGNFNPTKWDYSSGKTWGHMLGGAVVGGLSGGIGYAIATSGIPMANTAGIAGASLTNSIGTHIYTWGQTPITMSLGVASYDFTNGSLGFLGKKENSFFENLGYGFGALANLPDLISLFGGGTSYDVNSARINTKLGDEWWGHSSGTGKDINVSVGPGASEHASKLDYFKIIGGERWSDYVDESGTWSIRVINVYRKILQRMTNNIAKGKGLFFGDLKWNLAGYSCVNHVARSLWAVGIPSLPINFHPHILNLQLLVRQLGIYSSPYLYNVK